MDREGSSGRRRSDAAVGSPAFLVQVPGPELAALQGVELGILREFIRVCEAHGLRYYIAYGSLLGAVRHRGFIPWDDDVDVTMPRDDYDRFAALCDTALSPGFRWQSHRTDEHYPHLFGKLLMSGTLLRHASEAHLPFQQSIYIDVFPLDGVPSSRWAAAAQRAILRVCRARLNMEIRPLGRTRRLVRLAGLIPRSLAVALLEAVSRLAPVQRCQTWACTAGPYPYRRRRFPRAWFGPGAPQTFEGLRVVGPSDWDAYLRQLYGDYMTLPPVAEQVGNHEVIELSLESGPDGPGR